MDRRRLMKGIYIAATRQHVGKTSVSMTLLQGLMERLPEKKFTYMKPVGQQYIVLPDELKIDKDVDVARAHYSLTDDPADMSPIIIEEGYTRTFLNGSIDELSQRTKILESFRRLTNKNDFVVTEGTGHCGVGSVIGLSNAKVASELGLDMVLVSNGGLGSTFDELTMNLELCLAYNVRVLGVVINKCKPDKVDMVEQYITKALERFYPGIPLLGVVPNKAGLDKPSALDFEIMFNAKLIAGEANRLRRFDKYELVTTSLLRMMEKFYSEKDSPLKKRYHSCYVTHTSRSDIILGLMSRANSIKGGHIPVDAGDIFEGGMLLTGSPPNNTRVPAFLHDYFARTTMPVLVTGMSTGETIKRVESYRTKLNASDQDRTDAVVDHYAQFIDFEKLVRICRSTSLQGGGSIW